LKDYKIFCFNGKPELIYVSEGSHTADQKIAHFDMDFKEIDIKRIDYKEYDKIPQKPNGFELMKNLATKLSKNIPHIRVDFYEIK
jgi:hypothetical protein